MKLMKFQEIAVEQLKKTFYTLWRDGERGAPIVFKSPTGSGKTIMTAEFLKRITGDMQFEVDKAFIWVSFNASSYEQSKDKLFDYYNGGVAGLNLLDLNDINNGQLEKNEVFFVNWQKLVSRARENRKLRTDGESNISFDTFISNTHKRGREIVLIIDEAHLAKDTDLANEVIQLIDPKLQVHISATPKHIPNADELSELKMGYVSVPHKEVVNAGLIKEKIIIMPKEEILELEQVNEEDLDNTLIDLAIAKKTEIAEAYGDKDINPLVLIQLPNDEKEKTSTEGQNKLEFTKEYLASLGVPEHKIAMWLSEKKENLDEIVKNNSDIDFLIFKQAVATGWDCPRAQVLVMFREIQSPIFRTQVLGRILRMPEAKAYTNPLLNRAYAYTSYEMGEIETGQKTGGGNKVAIYKSNLRDGIDNIELPSVFLKRGKYNDLGDTFQQTFIPVANKYFGLTGKEIMGDAEKKLLEKGFNINAQEVKNRLIVDAEIEVYDDFKKQLEQSAEKLDHKASYHDTQKLYNLLLWREIANQEEDKKKFAPERSWGKLKTAINVWLREHIEIQNPPLYSIVCNDLGRGSDSVLKRVIAKALETYKPIRNKEEEEKLAKSEEPLIFSLQDQYSYTDDYEEVENIKLSANLPFYIHSKYTGKQNEMSFIEHLEKQKIDWWFKNGDYGRNNFAIKYKDENDELKLFYPDFIVRQGNKLGIFDTKSGQTAKSATHKAEALQSFISAYKGKYTLWGGIVVASAGTWKLNSNKKYKFNEKDLSDWANLTF